MHRNPRNTLLGAALAAALLTTGCASTITGTAGPVGASSPLATGTAPAATTDPVAWVDRVCGSLLPFVKIGASPPDINSSDPKAAITGLSSYLGKAVTALDGALAGLKQAGPAPIKGGDEGVTALTGALTTYRKSFQDAKTQLDAVDPNDVSQLATALPAALEPLQSLSDLPDPTSDLKGSPELDAAAKQAPNCKALPGN